MMLKVLHFVVLLWVCGGLGDAQEIEFKLDQDIQDAAIAIIRTIPRSCPMVIIYDEQMPAASVSINLIQRLAQHERKLLLLNLSPEGMSSIRYFYNISVTEDKQDHLLASVLYNLYRRERCYIFLVWVKDPRLLYFPDSATEQHPGWRKWDHMILVAHHITKRYKALINLPFWSIVPNIVGLKRNNEELQGTAVNIFTVLPYYRKGRNKPQEIDVWLVKERTFRKNATLYFEKFDNLFGAPLKIALYWKEPFLIWGNKKDPWMDGIDVRLLSLCIEALNFTMEYENVWESGRKLGGTWTGLLGKISNGTVDVGIGGVSITAERQQTFDFCRIIYADSFNFIAPLNLKVSTALDTFIQPLSDEVWLGGFISIIVGVFTLKIVALLEGRIRLDVVDSHFTSLANNCGLLVTLFCQKPYRNVPRHFALQIVYLGLIFMTFLLGMAFSSCLISLVLGFRPKPIADKVEDILGTRLPIYIKESDRLIEYMNTSSEPLLREILAQGTKVSFFETLEIVDEVVKGNAIFIGSKAKLEFGGKYRYSVGEGTNMIKFHISSGSILKFDNLAWPVNRNWPLTEKFNQIISRAVEGGLVQHWMSKFRQGKFGYSSEAWKIPPSFSTYLSEVKETPEIDINQLLARNQRFVRLKSEHLAGVYTLYVVGIVLSICVFAVECLYKLFAKMAACFRVLKDKLQKRKERKRTKGKAKSHTLPDLVWSDFASVRALEKLD